MVSLKLWDWVRSTWNEFKKYRPLRERGSTSAHRFGIAQADHCPGRRVRHFATGCAELLCQQFPVKHQSDHLHQVVIYFYSFTGFCTAYWGYFNEEMETLTQSIGQWVIIHQKKHKSNFIEIVDIAIDRPPVLSILHKWRTWKILQCIRSSLTFYITLIFSWSYATYYTQNTLFMKLCYILHTK